MQLPIELQKAIQTILPSRDLSDLSEGSQELSQRYRKRSPEARFVATDQDRSIYVHVRMPATFAAIGSTFQSLLRKDPLFAPQSLLDLGSGPGTGLWAAAEYFPSLQSNRAWEKDTGFIALGQKLLKEAGFGPSTVEWSAKDLTRNRDFPSSDLILLSYALNEIKEEHWEGLFKDIWDKTQKAFVLVEPGTPEGYRRILHARTYFLKQGAHIMAPCTHPTPCPMEGRDWCHFYARVERSSLHRKIKSATLNYEDEKFSYLIVSKQNIDYRDCGRIVRHPQIHKGYVKVNLCTKEGIQTKTITKSDKENYKLIKKLGWGDLF